MPSVLARNLGRQVQAAVSKVLNNFGHTVVRFRPAHEDKNNNYIAESTVNFIAFKLTTREEKVHDTESYGTDNWQNPDLSQWGFPAAADVKENDIITFPLFEPLFEYVVTKSVIPEGIADIVLMRVYEIVRRDKL